MGLFRRVFSPSKKESEDEALWLYVRCDNCGAKIRIRVDRGHDLTPDYEGGYVLRKEIMDNKCFKLMHGEVFLDKDYKVVSQEVSGGRFITKEDYESPE